MLSLYSAQATWLHRVGAAPKLAVLCVLGSSLLLVGDLRWLVGGCALAIALFASLGMPAWRYARRLRSMVVMAALIAAFHVWLGSSALGLASALRLVTGIVLAAMLTLTTRFDDLLDVLEALLRPLEALGVSTARLALALALVLRFIDVFHGQWQRLDDAHRARAGRAGGVRLLAPLTLRTLQTADRVADALAARLGY